MARGRSVVSADVPGAAEALGENVGAIVAVGDRPALATAVAERLADPALAGAEGRANRAAAEAKFDFRRVGDAVAQLYLDVV
jgi:glycosyltransferase involved in cell wall biosynthesis